MSATRLERTVYRLGIMPGEYEEDSVDNDEWFASLKLAKERRAELIASDPELGEHRTGEDFEISRITLAPFGRKALLLAVLNRSGFVLARRIVVPAYKGKRGR